jgi:hypothetical protein
MIDRCTQNKARNGVQLRATVQSVLSVFSCVLGTGLCSHLSDNHVFFPDQFSREDYMKLIAAAFAALFLAARPFLLRYSPPRRPPTG